MRDPKGELPPLERTQVVVAPVFHRSGKAWRPCRLQGLPRLSRAEAGLPLLLEAALPRAERTRLLEAVRGRLEGLFQEKVQLEPGEARLVAAESLRRQLPDTSLFAVLSTAPHQPRLLLEVELPLAHGAVDLLLGGAGETVGLRPLTDIEEGVAGFALLESLRAAAGARPSSGPPMRLEGLVRSAAEALAMLGEGHLLLVQVRATLGAHAGALRLLLPESLLAQGAPEAAERERRARARAGLSRVRELRTWLQVEIGRAELTYAELCRLRERDVVLLEHATARPDRREAGTAQVRVGLGRRGHFEAQVALDGEAWKAKLKAFHPGAAGRNGSLPSAEDEAAADAHSRQRRLAGAASAAALGVANPHPTMRSDVDNTAGDAGDLLGDIPLQLSVELSRLPVTAEEVAALRPGQVLELQRAAGDPVELSVNGKVVAHGELVEVEGQLGVRVLSLAG